MNKDNILPTIQWGNGGSLSEAIETVLDITPNHRKPLLLSDPADAMHQYIGALIEASYFGNSPVAHASHTRMLHAHLESFKRSREDCPFDVPTSDFPILDRYAIEHPVPGAPPHRHPINKALENRKVKLLKPFLEANQYTLWSIKEEKVAGFENPAFIHNPIITGKDYTRYASSPLTSYPPVTTPVLVIHDVPFFGPDHIAQLLRENPQLQHVFLPTVAPVDLLHQAPSSEPGLYQLEYHGNSYTWTPEQDGQGSYTQPISTSVDLLTANSLNLDDVNFASVNRIWSASCHHVFLISRGKHELEVHRSFDVHDYLEVPVQAMPFSSRAARVTSRQLVEKTYEFVCRTGVLTPMNISAKLSLVVAGMKDKPSSLQVRAAYHMVTWKLQFEGHSFGVLTSVVSWVSIFLRIPLIPIRRFLEQQALPITHAHCFENPSALTIRCREAISTPPASFFRVPEWVSWTPSTPLLDRCSVVIGTLAIFFIPKCVFSYSATLLWSHHGWLVPTLKKIAFWTELDGLRSATIMFGLVSSSYLPVSFLTYASQSFTRVCRLIGSSMPSPLAVGFRVFAALIGLRNHTLFGARAGYSWEWQAFLLWCGLCEVVPNIMATWTHPWEFPIHWLGHGAVLSQHYVWLTTYGIIIWIVLRVLFYYVSASTIPDFIAWCSAEVQAVTWDDHPGPLVWPVPSIGEAWTGLYTSTWSGLRHGWGYLVAFSAWFHRPRLMGDLMPNAPFLRSARPPVVTMAAALQMVPVVPLAVPGIPDWITHCQRDPVTFQSFLAYTKTMATLDSESSGTPMQANCQCFWDSVASNVGGTPAQWFKAFWSNHPGLYASDPVFKLGFVNFAIVNMFTAATGVGIICIQPGTDGPITMSDAPPQAGWPSAFIDVSMVNNGAGLHATPGPIWRSVPQATWRAGNGIMVLGHSLVSATDLAFLRASRDHRFGTHIRNAVLRKLGINIDVNDATFNAAFDEYSTAVVSGAMPVKSPSPAYILESGMQMPPQFQVIPAPAGALLNWDSPIPDAYVLRHRIGAPDSGNWEPAPRPRNLRRPVTMEPEWLTRNKENKHRYLHVPGVLDIPDTATPAINLLKHIGRTIPVLNQCNPVPGPVKPFVPVVNQQDEHLKGMPFAAQPVPAHALEEEVISYKVDYGIAQVLCADLKTSPTSLSCPNPLDVIKMVDACLEEPEHEYVDVHCYFGVGGCGKTRAYGKILESLTAEQRNSARIVTPNANLRDKMRQDLAHFGLRSNSFPSIAGILSEPAGGIIMFEEAGLFWPGFIECVMACNPSSERFYVNGDPLQCRDTLSIPGSCSRKYPNTVQILAQVATKYATISHRIPRGTARLLGLHTTSQSEEGVSIVSYPAPGYPILTTSPKYAAALNASNYDAYTFRDAQGQDYETPVTADITGLEGALSDTTFYVGLTRSKSTTYINTTWTLKDVKDPTAITGSQMANALMVVCSKHAVSTVNRDLGYVAAAFQAHWKRVMPQFQFGIIGLSSSKADVMQLYHPSVEVPYFYRGNLRDGTPQQQHCSEEPISELLVEPFVRQTDPVTDELVIHGESTQQFNPEPYLVNPQHHTREDRATEQASIQRRFRPATAEGNRRDYMNATDNGMMDKMRELLNLSKPEQWDTAKFDLCLENVVTNWLKDRTATNVRNAMHKQDLDALETHPAVFLKGQFIKKLEKFEKGAVPGQMVTEFPLEVTLYMAAYAQYLEDWILSVLPRHIHFLTRANPAAMSSWYDAEWDSEANCTGNDYAGWDTGCDAPVLKFDVALLGFLNFPQEFINRYLNIRLNSFFYRGALPIMQFSGDRFTWILNSIRNMVITNLAFSIPLGAKQVYNGDDFVGNGTFPLNPNFDPSKWTCQPKPVWDHVMGFSGYLFGMPCLTRDLESLHYRLSIAVARGRRDLEYYRSTLEQFEEVHAHPTLGTSLIAVDRALRECLPASYGGRIGQAFSVGLQSIGYTPSVGDYTTLNPFISPNSKDCNMNATNFASGAPVAADATEVEAPSGGSTLARPLSTYGFVVDYPLVLEISVTEAAQSGHFDTRILGSLRENAYFESVQMASLELDIAVPPGSDKRINWGFSPRTNVKGPLATLHYGGFMSGGTNGTQRQLVAIPPQHLFGRELKALNLGTPPPVFHFKCTGRGMFYIRMLVKLRLGGLAPFQGRYITNLEAEAGTVAELGAEEGIEYLETPDRRNLDELATTTLYDSSPEQVRGGVIMPGPSARLG